MTRPKILAIDNDEQFLEMMREVLENKGFEVTPAANLVAALKRMVMQPFDALITELEMPLSEDGFALVTAMRHCQPKAMRIVVSASSELEGAIAIIHKRVDEILVKPFDFEYVVKLILKRISTN